jgi:hypothetical protein
MKFAPVFALLMTSAAAFTAPTMTFAVGKKKAPAKKAPAKEEPAKKGGLLSFVAKVAPKKAAPVKSAPVKAAAKASPFKAFAKKAAPAKVKKAAPKPAPKPKPAVASSGTIPSTAIPYEDAPAMLDGSLIGDVGFDPCFLSTKADTVAAPYFNGLFEGKVNLDGLTWYREAELMHGRICMVAVLGFIAPGFGTFDGNEWTGSDAFSYTNPLEALDKAPSASLFQIFAFMAILEFRRINIIFEQGSSYQAGDSQRWGQGEGRWNPLGLDYSPEEYEIKQLQEIKHARLAMIGLLGLIFQANASGVNVVQQWSTAFTVPEYTAKAGYFLPEGI